MVRMKAAVVFVVLVVSAVTARGAAPGPHDLQLPVPRTTGGKPLMQALSERQSARDFSPAKLPPQALSNLLWAAFGINRPESGKRTAPSARNWQEVELYVILEEGAYIYEPAENRLRIVSRGDHRKLSGIQGFVATAPLNLVYVADTTKMRGTAADDRMLYAGADTGFIAQNVYLFCASEGLATVVRASVNRPDLAAALRLPGHKLITLSQTVGYPASKNR